MLNEDEKWVPSYEGVYSITKSGNVYKHIPGTGRVLMKPYYNNKHGFVTIGLTSEGVQTIHYLHRLIAEAFLSNDHHCKEVSFKDGNKCNVHIDNLSWSYEMRGTLPPNCRWVRGFEGLYYLNNDIEVFNKKGEKLSKVILNNTFRYCLRKNGKYHTVYGKNL